MLLRRPVLGPIIGALAVSRFKQLPEVTCTRPPQDCESGFGWAATAFGTVVLACTVMIALAVPTHLGRVHTTDKGAQQCEEDTTLESYLHLHSADDNEQRQSMRVPLLTEMDTKDTGQILKPEHNGHSKQALLA